MDNMDIQKQLETAHSRANTLVIVKYIGNDKERFKLLMDIFRSGEYRLTQRAAWPLSYIGISNPELVKPYVEKLIGMLMETKHHPAIPRNILRLFQDTEIPEKYHGRLIDICFQFIINQTQPLAVRAFAITVASKICTKYPELKKELLMILNDLNQFPQAPAIKVRIREAYKILSQK